MGRGDVHQDGQGREVHQLAVAALALLQGQGLGLHLGDVQVHAEHAADPLLVADRGHHVVEQPLLAVARAQGHVALDRVAQKGLAVVLAPYGQGGLVEAGVLRVRAAQVAPEIHGAVALEDDPAVQVAGPEVHGQALDHGPQQGLALEQGLAVGHLLGHVGVGPGHAQGPAPGVPGHDLAAVQDVPPGAVRGAHPEGGLVGRGPALQVVAQQGLGGWKVRGVHEPAPGVEGHGEGVRGVAQHGEPAFSGEHPARGDVPVPDGVRGALQGQGQALLAFAQGLLGPAALGHVPGQAEDQGRGPVRAPDRAAVHADPALLVVREPADAELHLVGRAVLPGLVKDRGHPRAVLGQDELLELVQVEGLVRGQAVDAPEPRGQGQRPGAQVQGVAAEVGDLLGSGQPGLQFGDARPGGLKFGVVSCWFPHGLFRVPAKEGGNRMSLAQPGPGQKGGGMIIMPGPGGRRGPGKRPRAGPCGG